MVAIGNEDQKRLFHDVKRSCQEQAAGGDFPIRNQANRLMDNGGDVSPI